MTSCSFALFFVCLFDCWYVCLFLLVAAMLIQYLDSECLYFFPSVCFIVFLILHCFEGSFPSNINQYLELEKDVWPFEPHSSCLLLRGQR